MQRQLGNERGITAFSLIEIVVVCAILVAMAAWIVPQYTGAGAKSPQEKAKTPIGRAHGVECQSYLSQVRSAVTMHAAQSEERPPATIQELKKEGVAEQQMYCPVGGKQFPYQYDPRTGRVWCTQPGHEKY